MWRKTCVLSVMSVLPTPACACCVPTLGFLRNISHRGDPRQERTAGRACLARAALLPYQEPIFTSMLSSMMSVAARLYVPAPAFLRSLATAAEENLLHRLARV